MLCLLVFLAETPVIKLFFWDHFALPDYSTPLGLLIHPSAHNPEQLLAGPVPCLQQGTPPNPNGKSEFKQFNHVQVPFLRPLFQQSKFQKT